MQTCLTLRLVTLCVIFQYSLSAEASLRSVITIFRHGDRSPIVYISSNPDQTVKWSDGPGMLTDRGLKQQFALGKWMRKRYDGFLGASYNRSELYVRSTDYDRTLMSAEAHLAGLFRSYADAKFKWNQELDWRPVPIHTAPQNEDALLDSPCEVYDQMLNQLQNAFFKPEEILNADLFRHLGNYSQIREIPPGVVQASWIWDSLHCEKQHGIPLPDWLNETVVEKLARYRDLVWQLMYYSDQMIRLRMGPFLKEVSTRFSFAAYYSGVSSTKSDVFIDAKLLDPKNYLGVHSTGSKFAIYSAHDSNLVGLLRVFGHMKNSSITPPYASCIIFELHQTPSNSAQSDAAVGDYFVKLLFVNDTIDVDSNDEDPEVSVVELKIAGCKEYCTLQEFIGSIERFIPSDRRAECSVGSSSAPQNSILKLFGVNSEFTLCVPIVVLLSIALVSAFVLCSKRDCCSKTKRDPRLNVAYSRLPQSGGESDGNTMRVNS